MLLNTVIMNERDMLKTVKKQVILTLEAKKSSFEQIKVKEIFKVMTVFKQFIFEGNSCDT